MNMYMSKHLNILISSSNMFDSYVYLPNIWGILKNETESFVGDKKFQFRWHPPLANKSNYILNFDFDIIGLSSYVWNFEYNCYLAKQFKKKNKSCIVIMGGPHPDWKDKFFFKKHSYIDFIVRQDGEVPFSKIINRLISERTDFFDIPGVYINVNKERISTGQPQLKMDFSESYWLKNKIHYEKLIKTLKKQTGKTTALLLETNRGCPYLCTFCDWGGLTAQKVRRFPTERVMEEIDWLGFNQVNHLELTDANFGMFNEDVDYARKMALTKKKYGYPEIVYYSPAKNHWEKGWEITQILYEAKLINHQQISLQTLTHSALKATKRRNLPPNQLEKLVTKLHENKVPAMVQFIIGQPGETLEGFINSLSRIIEKGIGEQIIVYLFMILPNTEAAEKTYQQKWKIKTVKRWNGVKRRKTKNAQKYSSIVEYCVGSDSYNRDYLVSMQMCSVIIQGLYGGHVLNLICDYLFVFKNIPVNRFLMDITEHFIFNTKYPVTHDIFTKVKDHFEQFIDPNEHYDSIFEEMNVEDYAPGFGRMLAMEEYVLFRTINEFSKWKIEFSNYLNETYGIDSIRDDLLLYQFNTLVTPCYNPLKGRSFYTERNWYNYFKHQRLNPKKKSIIPQLNKTFYSTRQSTVGTHGNYKIDWHYENNKKVRLIRFIETCIGTPYNRTNRTVLKEFDLISNRLVEETLHG